MDLWSRLFRVLVVASVLAICLVHSSVVSLRAAPPLVLTPSPEPPTPTPTSSPVPTDTPTPISTNTPTSPPPTAVQPTDTPVPTTTEAEGATATPTPTPPPPTELPITGGTGNNSWMTPLLLAGVLLVFGSRIFFHRSRE